MTAGIVVAIGVCLFVFVFVVAMAAPWIFLLMKARTAAQARAERCNSG